jgi:RNase H-fold protein (predicted Holliday junction resolvase)
VRELGGSTRGRKGDVDALAATVLLQHALNHAR